MLARVVAGGIVRPLYCQSRLLRDGSECLSDPERPKRIFRPVEDGPEQKRRVKVSKESAVHLDVTIKDLLEAGLHFGHQTKRWNPKMKRFVFDERNGIYIIDLAKTLVLLGKAQEFMYDTVVRGRSVLFVGTKKQARDVIEETARKLNQHYVTHRWLGGMLTNHATVRKSVGRMRELEALEREGAFARLPKKEVARLRRELQKLQRNLSGVAEMKELPGAVFVVDINREAIAVAEANRLKIPVVAIVDTNCDPDPVDYPIPGNDDAIRAIRLVVNVMAETIQQASNEYAKAAAEEARRRAAEEAEAAERARREDEIRRRKEEEARKARAEAISKAKSKAAEAAGDEKVKEAAAGETAEEGAATGAGAEVEEERVAAGGGNPVDSGESTN